MKTGPEVKEGETVWIVDKRCPHCGMPLYTQGREEWCAAFAAAWGACYYWRDLEND